MPEGMTKPVGSVSPVTNDAARLPSSSLSLLLLGLELLAMLLGGLDRTLRPLLLPREEIELRL